MLKLTNDLPAAGVPHAPGPGAAENAIVKSAIAYWHSIKEERRFPARSDLTLRGMATVLPYTLIVAVIDNGADYEYRYVGDAERQAFKRDFKGARLSSIETQMPAFGRILRHTYNKVRTEGLPFVIRGLVDHPHESLLPYHETAFLPLGVSDDAVDFILIVGVSVPAPKP